MKKEENKSEVKEQIITSPLKAIRAKCFNCSHWSREEVKFCGATECFIYPFRFGTNPYRTKKVLSEIQKEKLKKGLEKFRAKKEK